MSGKKIALVVGILVLLMLLCGGGGAALWYFKYGPGAAVPDVGPLPGRALAMPADTGVVGGFDLKAFLASKTYKQLSSGRVEGLPPAEAEKVGKEAREGIEKGLKEAESKIGVRLDKDVDRLVLGLWNVAADKPEGALIAVGRFDRAKIQGAVTQSAKAEGDSWSGRSLGGIDVQTLTHAGKPTGAYAFLDDQTVVIGSPAGVEAVVSNQTAHTRPFETNAGMLGLVKGLDAASGYWLVLGEAVGTRAAKDAPAPPGMIPKTLTLAGKFEGALQLAAEMADEAAAKNLSDMAQGGLGMAKMQLAQNAEAQKVAGLRELIDGITIKAEGKRVVLSVPPAGPGVAGGLANLALPSLLGLAGSSMTAESAPPATEPEPEQPTIADEPTPEPMTDFVPPVTTSRPTPRPSSRPVVRATPRAAAPTPRPAVEEDEPEPTPPPRPTGPIRVGGEIKEPTKLKHVSPNYPAAARKARAQGIVILEATIDTRGHVADVRVLRSVPLLDEAAVEAVRQWIYAPTLLNGVAMPVIMTVTVNFKLN